MGANAVIGGGLPHITGAALAFQMRGEPRVALAFFGDGATNIGTFHEALNLAGVRRAPVVFVLKNNGWAISTPVRKQTAAASFAARAAGYGRPEQVVAGRLVFDVGDDDADLFLVESAEIDVLQGEVDAEPVLRAGPGQFVGELNLLTGQTVFLTAIATEQMRYIAVDRLELRTLLFEDPDLADLLLSAFVSRRELLQAEDGLGIEVIGPRSSERTRGIVEWLRSARIPYRWRDPEHQDQSREVGSDQH
jgi:hypothetical protein